MNPVLNPKKNGSNIKKPGMDIDNQPPRNMITVNRLIKIIEPYSARKKSAKPILAYSTLKPDTNSDSASGRSNGARFVSAKIETRNMINKGNNGIAKKICCWNNTMSMKFNDPTQISIVINIKPIETSYEIICAELRNAPKKAYFELLDQPDIITP